MDIDDKIATALRNEAFEIDKLMLKENGLFHMAGSIMRGRLRFWVIAVNGFALLMTAVFAWCLYEFWTTDSLDDRIFWGVCFLAAFQAQIALKMWLFMEMGRHGTVRELKRIEIELARLATRLDKRAA